MEYSKEIAKDVGSFNEYRDGNHEKQFTYIKNIYDEKTPLLTSLPPKESMYKINKPLLPLKIFLLIWYGGTTVIEAFLMLYFKQLGLSVLALAVINVIRPFATVSGPIISGIIADKIGSPKPVIIANMVISFLAANSMLFIPRISTVTEMKVVCSQPTADANCILRCPNTINVESLTDLCCFVDKFDLCKIDQQFYDMEQRSENFQDQIIQKAPLWSLIPQTNCSIRCHNYNWEAVNDELSDFVLVFTLSLILIVCFQTNLSITYRVMDSTVMNMASNHGSDFGKERVWCTLGLMIFPPIAGYLIEVATPPAGQTNYTIAFYIFDASVILSTAFIFILDVQIVSPEKAVWKKTLLLLQKTDFTIFALALLILGSSYGFEKIFGTLFLDELHASPLLISFRTSIVGLVGLPFLYASDWWIGKFGTTRLVLCAFLGHIIYSTIFSILYNPWFVLFLEILTIFTYHLLWVSSVRHCQNIAPEGLIATVTATAGAIHFGLGDGVGSLVGGVIMGEIGARWAFRVIAIICAAGGLLYAIYLYFQHRKMKKKICV